MFQTEDPRVVGKKKDSLVRTITVKDSTGEMKASLWGSAANKCEVELGQQVVLTDSTTYWCNHNKQTMINVNNSDQVQVSTFYAQ